MAAILTNEALRRPAGKQSNPASNPASGGGRAAGSQSVSRSSVRQTRVHPPRETTIEEQEEEIHHDSHVHPGGREALGAAGSSHPIITITITTIISININIIIPHLKCFVVVGWNHPGLGSEMRDRVLPLPAAYLPAVMNDNGHMSYSCSSCGVVTHSLTHSHTHSLSFDDVVCLRMDKVAIGL
ncbi:uncharacterized protein K489DRAFT_400218 [Dissoconium aciculare CBS 342.82]|uniref:Uncharacterized protein n=1 Tax=Dissoconium aciculare CBS 342.82 TaxID=1314786 RepID=A0A6J3MBX5_9PEZI|nr:uncharacterized protein K489DRAFT_400218 [Dissoconium aciculare CBS 342.82]KAF1824342.1 hypothetical protein K489DRAFT_400218 [Dissoconium aciculare CBS 342.82]